MIEGLKVTVSGSKLRELCWGRVEYHRSRSAAYAEQVRSMEADKIEGMQYTNGDPVQSLKDRQKQHEGEADELQFIGDNIEVSESYLLDRSDLAKLGICKSRY